MKINDGLDFIKAGTPLHLAGFSLYSTPIRNNIFELLNVKLQEKYRPSNYKDDSSIDFLTKNVVIDDGTKPNDESDVILFSQVGGGLCSGDSGGPTMIKSDNHLFLVGINRSVNGPVDNKFIDCEYTAKSTSVAFHKTWINETLAEAQAEQPEFVTSVTLKDMDSKELQCGKILNNTAYTYLYLDNPNKKLCDSESDTDVIKYLTSLDEKCQEACSGVRGFEGQCDFYIKGAEKMQEAYKTKCEVHLNK